MIQITHRFEMREGIPQVVIYAYTPIDYEFATDFGTIKYNATHTKDKIKEYITKNISLDSNPTFMIILNGVVLGSIDANSLK